jgi:hypothetical protein
MADGIGSTWSRCGDTWASGGLCVWSRPPLREVRLTTERDVLMQFMKTAVPRRRAILLLGCATVVSTKAQTEKSATKIHQEVDFQVAPARIYRALLDAKQFSALTGRSAEIQAQPGGSLKLFLDARLLFTGEVRTCRTQSWNPPRFRSNRNRRGRLGPPQ